MPRHFHVQPLALSLIDAAITIIITLSHADAIIAISPFRLSQYFLSLFHY